MSHLPSPTSPLSDDNSGPYAADSTPTPTQGMPNPRGGISHSAGASAVSQWSAPDTPHHHAGTSYFALGTSSSTSNPTALRPPASPSVGGGSGAGTSRSARPGVGRSLSTGSTRRVTRSNSVASSHAYSQSNGVPEEDDEDADADDELLSRSRTSNSRGKAVAAAPGLDGDGDGDDEDEDDDDNGDDGDSDSSRDDEPLTLKERQSLINVEHPFGLPIWKPALYKKSRSVTRHADEALHSIPSAQAERHLLPGNIFWTALFGWWLAITFFVISGILYIIPMGGRSYSNLVFGLGWYVAWPFGKYVEGEIMGAQHHEESYEDTTGDEREGSHNGNTQSEHSTIRPSNHTSHAASLSWNSSAIPNERSRLLPAQQPGLLRAASRSYGTSPPPKERPTDSEDKTENWLGKSVFWLSLVCVIAPLLLFVCLICWGLVITIPMARLNWQLIQYLFERPTTIRFCAAPPALVQAEPQDPNAAEASANSTRPKFSVKHPRLAAGQTAPSSPTSTVLLCTYRAVGWKYYKYTVGGVNILFINLMPVVFFVILDGMVLLRIAERREHVPALLAFLTSRALIFVLSLASVIPLSYFIGMAVASISAQSSIGMGAVINATFGSIIEVLLYSIALADGKGRLVEGSIVGSLLAGILLMPGMSMVSSAMRRKEQKFNAKSAGVTSMMLIMAFIGTLSPTLFYQIYGNFQLVCTGCPTHSDPSKTPWVCDRCYYEHPDPVQDPFYQSTVKSYMFLCAAILLFSYLIGLWFSLRTHATQIWQNPQELMHKIELGGATTGAHPHRVSLFQPKNIPASLSRKRSNVAPTETEAESLSHTPLPRAYEHAPYTSRPVSPVIGRRVSYAPSAAAAAATATGATTPGLLPVLDTVDSAVKAGLQPIHLPESMTTEEFTRAVAVATVSALRHQQHYAQSPARARTSGAAGAEVEAAGGHGGHDAPSWSRTTSASVLLICTALYAMIAEILVDVVDVILEGSGIQEKFLGITLFALVPNTTEFMNAISFALNGNIALSMEIGSAYALQVCLLQIPAMVAFSAWYNPEEMGRVSKSFTLIFPSWDVIVIILSVFLMTYTYIEAKSNYHRGSILILSYIVFASGFYFAPPIGGVVEDELLTVLVDNNSLSTFQSLYLRLSSLFL